MNKKWILPVICVVVVLCVVFVLILVNKPGTISYDKAYDNTKKLDEYEMEIYSSIEVNDSEVKKVEVTQNVMVEKKLSEDMLYSVVTNSSAADTTNENVVKEESSYIYSDGYYYHSQPGVKYAGATNYDEAKANVEKLSGIILFEYDAMKNLETVKTENGTEYSFGVDYKDVSEHVKALLGRAQEIAEGDDVYSMKDLSVKAVEKDGYVTSGSLYVLYESEIGNTITIEISTELLKKDVKIEKPDKSKFVDISQ